MSYCNSTYLNGGPSQTSNYNAVWSYRQCATGTRNWCFPTSGSFYNSVNKSGTYTRDNGTLGTYLCDRLPLVYNSSAPYVYGTPP